MNLLPIIDRLASTGLGVKGKTLFLQMMPSDTSSAILLRDPLGGTKIDYYLPDYYKTDFQLIVRSTSYPTGETLTKAVCDALTFYDENVGPQHFQYCRPRTLPSAFPLSKGNLVEYNVIFDCCYVEPR